MSTLKVKGISAPTGYNLQMPAGHIVQVVNATSVLETTISNFLLNNIFRADD